MSCKVFTTIYCEVLIMKLPFSHHLGCRFPVSSADFWLYLRKFCGKACRAAAGIQISQEIRSLAYNQRLSFSGQNVGGSRLLDRKCDGYGGA